MRRALFLGLGFVLFGFGCGGSTVSVVDDDGGQGGDAGGGDSSSVDGATRADSGAFADSGGSCSLHTRPPKQNRPQGGQCPALRGAGMTGSGGAPGVCTKDADCTSGRNGRCLLRGFGVAILSCSYDECTADSDCAGNVPCDCRESDTSTAANVCGTGSGCRVNGDCGPCGFCSPSQAPNTFCFGRNVTYFCHTPADTCIDDTDCTGGTCNLDPMTKHWACVTVCSPPPP